VLAVLGLEPALGLGLELEPVPEPELVVGQGQCHHRLPVSYKEIN
jgi:hypothetical protein